MQERSPSWTREQGVRVARVTFAGTECLLGQPLTYMNRAGAAARHLRDGHGVDPARLLVVSDDFALPLGRLRLRPQGSAGGHKGLASVAQALGTESYPRLRVGIGEVPPGEAETFVLERFRPSERPVIEEALARAAEGVRLWISEGIERAMARVNG